MKARGYLPTLQLVRIPAVFSSLSNAFAGFWIGGGDAGWPVLVAGMAAAGFLLLAGMALNDIADRKVDAVERPQRPLPSGAISPAAAWMLSLGMMALALALLWWANPVSALTGAMLVLSIFLYNFALKKTFLGPAAMGLCRLLNLLTGVALTADGTSELAFLPDATQWALFSLWLYVAAVTFIARDEVRGNSPRRMRLFFFLLGGWAALWIVFAAKNPSPVAWILVGVLLFLFRLLQAPLTGLWKNPGSPPATGKTVNAMLRAMPLTDCMGMLAAGVSWPLALSAVLFMLPGPYLAKRFYST